MDRPHRGNPVKVGVVGFGYWGPKLVRNYREMPEATLAFIVDSDAGRLARVRKEYPGVRTTADYTSMLKSDVEAVVIATPIRTHYQLAKAALLAGKHVLVEKPLAANGDQARELSCLADQHGLTLMVGHTFEYHAAIRKLRDIVRSGEIGDVLYVDAARLNLGLFQPDINVLWDLAPHDLSILLYVLGMDPVEVSARGSSSVHPGIHDVAYVEVRFPQNVLAHLHLSWLDPCKVRRITIVGSKKMVVCNDVSDTEKLRIYDKGVDVPFETDQYSQFHLEYRYGTVSIPFVPMREPLRIQCEHFIECVRTGAHPQSDGWVGAKVVQIIEQADKSLHNGGGREPALLDFQTPIPTVPTTDAVLVQ